jgi:type IV secretion system protein TrbL
MQWLRRAALLFVVGILAAAAPLADPDPPQAKATALPCIGLSPAGVVGDALNIGNPVGDACDAVTDPILGAASDAVLGPLKDAASSIGKGIFNQVTSWVADGAVWLIGEVAAISEKTTSPDLLSRGFLRQYRLMAMIAAFMAALMVIFAVFESLGRGDAGMLWRVLLVNVPLAAIATTVAYVVVQLLIAVCDEMCFTIARSTGADSREFFKGAIEALAEAGASGGAVAGTSVGGPGVGTAVGEANGAVAVPLFVGFIAAIVAAFAAFFVWIELLMRDTAIYVVALFMPLAIAASIWPRWTSALRRTCELLIVVIFSKFVIVAIVSLAASLLAKNDGAVEHVLAAGAMLLLACFAPFVLFKLVPFAEEAASAAFSRQSASGSAVRTVEFANSMMMVHRLSRANWAAASEGEGGGRGAATQGKSAAGGSGSGGGSASAAEGAAAGGAAAGAVPVAAAATAAKAGPAGAGKLSQTGEAHAAGETGGSPRESSGTTSAPGGNASEAAARPSGAGGSGQRSSAGADSGASSPSSSPPGAGGAEPQDAGGGSSSAAGGEAAPRPPAEKRDSGPSGAEK